MSRKKKHPEHENLERWLVSYADFITLLFATFVVLYALSQADIAAFTKLEDSIRKAFSSKGVMDGSQGVLESSQSLLEGSQGSEVNPLMLEYLSQKYEEVSYQEIKDDVENLKLDGIDVSVEERGLVIRISDKVINFASGSAKITPESQRILSQIGNIIFSRFQIHLIKVEGHTDSSPTSKTSIYPTNWELSGARASSVINYFIDAHRLSPKLFIAMGYADTVPLKGSEKNPAINRRVEIVVTRNKYKIAENNDIKTLINTKDVRSKYIKNGTSPKRDAENVLENKELVAPANVSPSAETNATKNTYENESVRIHTEGAKHGINTMPDFLKEETNKK